ncbi:hypothetical protein ACNUIM_32120 [Pseudomonas aeruginosa]|uniref:hypothetical protein n=1 Tax=Pseudomonas aeruginosa TaxID=287 RepID=UPI003AABA8AD
MPSRTRWSPSSQKPPKTAEIYKKRSASVYLPDSPGNPGLPGKRYLRHIGFLGAVPPAVEGIPANAFFDFAEDDGDLIIEFAEAPYAVTALPRSCAACVTSSSSAKAPNRADQLIPQWQLSSIEEDARRAVTHGASIQRRSPNPQ